jgi:hypothetical protein
MSVHHGTETTFELTTIQHLEGQGYQHLFGLESRTGWFSRKPCGRSWPQAIQTCPATSRSRSEDDHSQNWMNFALRWSQVYLGAVINVLLTFIGFAL